MADIRRRAAAYSNPRLGAAFENIADMFAPPSGSDLYGYTRAGAEKAKAERLADLWGMRDNLTQDQYDRAVGIVTGAPISTGYYGVNTKAATDRRGQDVTSRDNRYNVDSRDRTSRANNADTNRTSVVVADTQAIPENAYRPERPKDVSDMYGLPARPAQSGNINVKPGERTVRADGGGVVEGAPKPKTRAEVEGDIVAGLSDEEKRAIGYGNTPVVETGKGPMTRPQQLQSRTPALDDKQPQAFNSSRGPVIWDPVKRAYVPAPAQGVDVSAGLQSPSGVQSKDPLGSTTANISEANRREAQLNVLDKTLDDYEALLKNNPGIIGIPGAVRGAAQNAVSVIQEFAAAFGNTPLDAIVTPQDAEQLAGRVGAGIRDPAIAQARHMQLTLAYKLAQMENASGEVSRQALERQLEVVTGGTLPNNQSALEAIQAMRMSSRNNRLAIATLRNPGGAPAPAGPRVLQTPAGTVTIEPVQ